LSFSLTDCEALHSDCNYIKYNLAVENAVVAINLKKIRGLSVFIQILFWEVLTLKVAFGLPLPG
jgi:hypothetical protein